MDSYSSEGQFQEGLEGLTPIEQEAAASNPSAAEAVEQVQAKATGEIDNPVGQFMEDAAVGIRDWVDNTFQGDQRTREEIAADRQGIRAEAQDDAAALQQQIDSDTSVGAEAVRAVAGGVSGVVEQTGEFGELLGDTGKTWLGIAEAEDNVFSDEYERADWNLGVSENKTAVGNVARTLVTFAVGLRQVGRIPGLGQLGAGSRVGRVAGETLRGGIVDLVLADTEEGGLANAIEEYFPDVKGTPIFGALVGALSVDEDANPWENKVKAIIEGGILGASVDIAGEVLGAIRAGRRVRAEAIKAGKTAEQAKEEALEATVKQLELDPLDSAPRQLTLDDAGLDMTDYQARQVRRTQETVYGSSPNRLPEYESDEAARRLNTNPPTDVAEAQFRLDDAAGELRGRSAPSLLTDAATSKIVSVAVDAAEEVELRNVVARVGASINVDELSKRLGQSNEETVAKAYNSVIRFLGAPEGASTEQVLRAFDGVKGTDAEGNAFLSREGVVAAKTLISDMAVQLNDLAANAQDLIANGRKAPVRQAEMLIDRMRGLVRLHKESAIHYGSGLQSFKLGPLELGNTPVKVAAELKKIDEGFADLLDKVRRGDAESITEFRNLTQGLVLADGDPLKQITFGALARRLGGRAALTTMYNSMLSGPLTHIRNGASNLFTMVLRPTSMAVGYALDGDIDAAKASIASLGAVGDAWGEAFSVAGKTWSTGIPVGGSQKFDKFTDEVAKELATLKQTARTDSEKRAADWIENLHNFTSNPWMDAPSRALSASDDFFKTLNARVELKRQAYMETLQSTGEVKFDSDVYARLADKKMKDGVITDDGLLQVTKEATFQQELEGTMKTVAGLIDSNPLAKYFIPFVRTGHNLAVYAGTFTPGLNRFLTEAQAIRNGSDEAAKAMLKGRVATGYGVLAMGTMMAAGGNLTGNGPADPATRKIWLRNNQPQSIKIGGNWVSYRSVEPLNVLFAATADLFEASTYLPEGDFGRLQAQLHFTFAKAFTERSYFSGLHSAIAYLNPGTAGNVNFLREGLGAINTFIPYAGARNQLGKALAPGMYEWNNEFEEVVGRALPGYKNFAQHDIDIFTGEPKHNTTDAGPVWHVINQFFPFNVTKDPNDPVIAQLAELNVSTTTDHGDTLKGVELTAEQRGQLNKLIAETGLHGDLKRLFGYEWFKNDVQAWKDSLSSGNPVDRKDTRWYKEITRRFSQSRRAAASQFAAQNPEFREQLRLARQTRYFAQRGEYDKVEQLQNYYKQ